MMSRAYEMRDFIFEERLKSVLVDGGVRKGRIILKRRKSENCWG